jgi:hypothetical protein
MRAYWLVLVLPWNNKVNKYNRIIELLMHDDGGEAPIVD